jgi:uncharacterized protein (DUF58 family)
VTDNLARPRVRLTLPLEGLVFLILLFFVAVCAVLRNVGMMIVFAGVMSIGWIMCWRFTRRVIRGLIVERIAPSRVHAGQTTNLQWQVSNLGGFDAFQLVVTDTICPINVFPSKNVAGKRRRLVKSTGRLVIDRVQVGESKVGSYQMLIANRGQYEFGPAVVSSSFPFTLATSWFRTAQRDVIYVAPRLGTLHPQWDRLFASTRRGSQTFVRTVGERDEEFFALRNWQSGDSLRHIHWRSTAKQRQPIIKQFDRLADRDLVLVLDLFGGPANRESSTEYLRRVETIVSFAATVVAFWSRQDRGSLLIGIAGDRTEVFLMSPQFDFATQVMRSLATIGHGDGSTLPATIQESLAKVRGKACCWLVSTRTQAELEHILKEAWRTQFLCLEAGEDQVGELFRLNGGSNAVVGRALFDSLQTAI